MLFIHNEYLEIPYSLIYKGRIKYMNMNKKRHCLRTAWQFLLLILIGVSPSLSQASSPAGYSEYFIPGPEDQLIIFHNAVNNTTFTTTHSIISVVAWSPNTVVTLEEIQDVVGINRDELEQILKGMVKKGLIITVLNILVYAVWIYLFG